MDLPDLGTGRDDLVYHGVGAAAGYAITRGIVELAAPDADRWKKVTAAAIPVVLVIVGKELYDREHPESHTCALDDALVGIGGMAFSMTVIDLRW